MNEHEKYKIMELSRGLRDNCNDFTDILSNQLSLEEDKLNNLPENLENSVIHSNIEQDIDNLNEAIDTLSEISSQIESFSDLLGFEFRKQRSKKTMAIPPSTKCTEKRTVRLQAVITPCVAKKLKAMADSCNISVNELLNRFIDVGLSM